MADYQQVQERPDGGGGDPAEIRAAPQHHHPQRRESLPAEFLIALNLLLNLTSLFSLMVIFLFNII